MGRKFTIPYGLYKVSGAVNPFFADKTKFSDADLELLFTALEKAFTLDASAARPADSMRARALLVFRHDGNDTEPAQRAQQAKLGCAPSHKLFEKLVIRKLKETPRAISDYEITFDGQPLDSVVKPGGAEDLGNGITLIRRI
jgi:CRISPR-associated protein Csd2